MQWMKRFWDTNYPGHPYDPVARRRGQSTETPATLAPITSARSVNTPGAPAARSGGKTPVGGHRTGSASAANHEQVVGLQAQLKEMSAHLEGLEKERDFYFAKVYLFYRPSFFLPWSNFANSGIFVLHSYAISRSWCSNKPKISQRKDARIIHCPRSRKFCTPPRCARFLNNPLS